MRVIAASLLVAVPALVSAAVTPVRRSISGQATWYNTETGNKGSCGEYLSNHVFSVAMNSIQYDQGMCGKSVRITVNGKSADATIKDLCPIGGGNCNYGDMDLSPDLFTFLFGDLGVGKAAMEWDFTDGSAPPTAPPQEAPPQEAPPQEAPSHVEPSPSPSPSPIIEESPVVYESPAPTPSTPSEIPTVDPTPVEQPPTTPVEQPTPTIDSYVEAVASPGTETTDCPTTTESTSAAAETTSTPSFGEQIALAMQEHDVSGLGAVFIELGNMLQNPPNPTMTPETPGPTY